MKTSLAFLRFLVVASSVCLLTEVSSAAPQSTAPLATQSAVQEDADKAPHAVIFSWDKQGKLSHLNLDAMQEDQNPPARALKRWLDKNAGVGKIVRKKES